ncbi:kinase-like domain-containing protein [Rhizophagus irregularis DAOM 181602=DAOM 197198]|nr:kinase-like domain-containing protein [Rhizophagus irregularis DAOM 181602=DAOM 197198]
MELVKLNDENSFDPTPKLKSNPVPIFFISFNWEDNYCFHCGEEYTKTTISIRDSYDLYEYVITVSSGCIESTLTKKFISIIYLPFWENTSTCFCLEKLIISINSGDSVLDNFLFNIRNNQLNQLNITKFVYDLKSNKYLIPSQIYTKTLRTKIRRRLIRYIPYSQLINVKKIEEGGFSIIYQATWLDSPNYNSIVILKRFKNLQYAKKYFFKELESNHRCYKLGCTVNETFGFTKDPKLDDYILVMQYASEGDLHKYLQKEFPVIDWKQKIRILNDISLGLFAVHDSNFIHRDLHSGNILFIENKYGFDFVAQFSQAELKWKDLIVSKKLGPEFSEKSHPKAIYTKELELDIDIKSDRLTSLGIKRNIEELNINSCENSGKRIKVSSGYSRTTLASFNRQ